MDPPLPIAASVSGLLVVAAHLASLLHAFISGPHDVPSLVGDLMGGVRGVAAALSTLRGHIWGAGGDGARARSREGMMMVSAERLVVVLTGCVCVFSELQREVVDAVGCGGEVLDSARWEAREEGIKALLRRVEAYRALLDLMVEVVESTTLEAAHKALEELHITTVHHDPPRDLPHHLRSPDPKPSRKSLPSYASLPGISRQPSPNPQLPSPNHHHHHHDPHKHSFWKPWKPRPRPKSTNYSHLSAISLLDIPHVPALHLPIHAADIANSGSYVFAAPPPPPPLENDTDTDTADAVSIVFSPPPQRQRQRQRQCIQAKWHPRAQEPHPNLSLLKNPKEVEKFLNELWASAYQHHHSPEEEDEEVGRWGGNRDKDGDGDSGSIHSGKTGYGGLVFGGLVGWAG